MNHEVLRSAACDRDLSLIFDKLSEAYEDLGDSPCEAFKRASARVRSILDDMEALGSVPFQGTLWSDQLPDLHWVTKNRMIFYFQIDDAAAVVRILAVFFGGQDHRMKMLLRLSDID